MFVLSKVVGVLTDVVTTMFLVIAAGFLLHQTRRGRRWGRRIVLAALGLSLILAVFPVERFAMTLLENRFAVPDPMPEKVDGIIVLGGALNPVVSAARGQPVLNGAVSRLTALVPLARRYPEARLVFSGGSGDLLEQRFKEAPYVRAFYEEIGFDSERVIFEERSRNTRENAVFSKEMLAPQPGETWLVVTSALHMARSVGCFRAVGWPVLAHPVDYRTTGREAIGWSELRFSVTAGLGGMQAVLHEVIGLGGYRLLGWSDSWFPAP